MYSISSQIFSGLTEYVLDSKENKVQEKDEQKGKFATGKIIADIIEKNSSLTEKKFLHDYSYVLFEEALLKENKVLVVDSSNFLDSISKIAEYNFIKITGRVIFNDSKTVEEVLAKFNEIGYAITVVTENSKSGSQQGHKNKNQILELAKKNGLQLDKEYLEKIKYMINFGYNEQFEALLPFQNEDSLSIFSALLKRELLTESEISITKKYSRETEKEFCIFGMLTQVKPENEKLNVLRKDFSQDNSSMKESLLNLIGIFGGIERTFHGKLGHEYVIDPIAVYREL